MAQNGSSNPWAGSYAPKSNVQCPPNTPLIRSFSPSNQTLNSDELSYINDRLQKVPQAWKDWLGDGSQLGYNLDDFKQLPRVGMAMSGGGFRASLYGASVMNAFDIRNGTAKAKGTGGFLQTALYMSGLSGGSWVISGLSFNNFPTLFDLVKGNDQISGFLLDIDIVIPDGINILSSKNQEYYGSVLSTVYAKADAGFDTSLSDPWSRLLSYHFLNGTTRANYFTNDTAHGAGLLWSDVLTVPAFINREMPFPIIVSDSQESSDPDGIRPPAKNVVYEITPYEMGSFDPNLSAMTPTKFIGTHLINGKPANNTACVTGFDQASFMIGSVSSLFNVPEGIVEGFSAEAGKALTDLLDRLLNRVSTRRDDVANWPNSFQGLAANSFEDTSQTWLNLVDGGENAENVPLDQLFLKPRGLDVVVAIDTTGETTLGQKNGFPNGTAIRSSRDRITTLLIQTHQGFPPVPDDFAATGVNLHPTFFGCDPSITNGKPDFPLLIYIPNSPPVDGVDPVTNTGSFKTSYTDKHQDLFMTQVFESSTSGFVNNSLGADPNFPKCLQCAAIDRARFLSAANSSTPIPRSEFCTTCFDKYCYSLDNALSNKNFPGRKFVFVDPDPSGLSQDLSFVKKHGVQLAIGIGVGVVCLLLLCAGM
ncbi:hypothetical protein M422DRAFT_156996 [Sphaerobolus stellatus SS14]|nr:hypothetical protein M422DRAFT_156996 [Sphaerobolus stellatus SS14]